MPRFVWVEGMRGPTPELWSDDYRNDDMQGRPRKVILQQHKVGNVSNMTLDALAAVYPLESKP